MPQGLGGRVPFGHLAADSASIMWPVQRNNFLNQSAISGVLRRGMPSPWDSRRLSSAIETQRSTTSSTMKGWLLMSEWHRAAALSKSVA